MLTRNSTKKKTPNKNTRKVLILKNSIYFQISNEEKQFNSQISEVVSQGPSTSCQCSKTHCLKLYCQCFHNSRFCGENCNCNDCYNDATHAIKRNEAIDFIKSKEQRNQIKELDVFDTSYVWGCKCKKTKCLKGYCECFIRGKKCTSHCKCDECFNKGNNIFYYINALIFRSDLRFEII